MAGGAMVDGAGAWRVGSDEGAPGTRDGVVPDSGPIVRGSVAYGAEGAGGGDKDGVEQLGEGRWGRRVGGAGAVRRDAAGLG